MSHVNSHAPGTPSWYDLMSPDLEGARAFYKALFGWDYFINGPEMGHYTIALKDGRPAAGLGPKPAGVEMPSVWSVYFATDDVDASLAAVSAHGGAITHPAHTVGEQGRLGMAADPSGAVFGFWQPGTHRGAEVVNEHGAMAWCEVNTREGEAVAGFYCAVMGLTAQPLPGGMAYWTLHQGDCTVAGVMQMNEQWPANLPAHWMPYFAVDNTDEAIDIVKGNGGALCVPAFDTPYGRMAVVADPFGGTFSIIQLKAMAAS